MPAKIHINIQEKKWLVIDLKDISKKAFKSTFKILTYSKIFKFIEVSILACNDQKIREYNRIYRNKDTATNVISWQRLKKLNQNGLSEKKDIPNFICDQEGTLDIGDIAISYNTCFKKARELNISFEDYIIHMLIHSCLHLLGFDHKNLSEYKKMNDIETKSLEECGIKIPSKTY